MKLNTSDFPLNKKILYGTDDGIIYDEEKCGLMETWDTLSAQYLKNIEKDNSKQILETESTKILKDIKVEVDTFMSTINLIEKNIIKSTPIQERNKEAYNFKSVMMESSIKILDKGIEALSKANKQVEDLNDVIFSGFDGRIALSSFGLPFKIVDGQFRVYFTEEDFAYVDTTNQLIYPSVWTPMGLVIIFKYGDNVFSTVYPPKRHKNEILNIKEYFNGLSLIGKKEKHNISFEIIRNTKDIQDQNLSEKKRLDILCKAILDIVINNNGFLGIKDEIFEYINIFISNVFIIELLDSLETYKIINLSDINLLDGLPKDFIVVSEKKYKFKREKFSFSFFINEERADLKFK